MPYLPATLIGVALLAAACAGDTNTAAPTTTTPPVTTSPTGNPAILDWEATLIGGGTINGADLAGHDTLFWFWAPT